jgi:hypothetical protein
MLRRRRDAPVRNQTISHFWNVAVTEVQTLPKLLLLAWLAPTDEDLTSTCTRSGLRDPFAT